MAFSDNALQKLRSKRLYLANFSEAYVADCQGVVAIVHVC